MSMLDPIKNLYSTISKVSQEAESLMGVVDSRGLTGVMKSLMGFDLEGMKKTIDAILGCGLIELLNEGNTPAVETTLAFRTYLNDYLNEMMALRALLIKFDSKEPGDQEASLMQMRALLAARKKPSARDREILTLTAEVNELRQTLNQISLLVAVEK